MKTSELTRKLRKVGCYITDHGKEHDEWFSPLTDKYFRVPRHGSKEIAIGTANSIMKDAGIR